MALYRHGHRPKGVAGSIGPIIPSGSSLFAGVGQGAGVAEGRAYAFDMRTGRLLWARPSAASSIPCLAVGTLFLSAGPLGAGDSYLRPGHRRGSAHPQALRHRAVAYQR